jgi:hypothetical protein
MTKMKVFQLKNTKQISLSLSSLCVIYSRVRSVRIETQKRVLLFVLLSVKDLLEADPYEF